MSVAHVFSNVTPDYTGTVTQYDSRGSTITVAATDLVRPSDWNSTHNQYFTLSGNTNNASTASGTNVVLSGSGGMTLAGSTQTIVLSISTSDPAYTYQYFNPQDAYVQAVGQQGQSTLHIQPAKIPNLTHDRIVLPVFFSNSSNSTGTLTLSMWIGFYTRTGSTLSLFTSYSSSNALSYNGSVNSASNNGIKLLTIGASNSLAENQYHVGILSASATAGTNASLSQVLASQQSSNLAGLWGQANNASIQYTRGLGVYSAATNNLPDSIDLSELRGTNLLVLRRPIFYLVNGTF